MRMLMPNARFAAVALLVSLVFAAPAHATLVDDPDVPAMVQASDLIVVGHVLRLRTRAAGQAQTAVLAVDRVLKGAGLRTVTLQLDASDLGSNTLAPQRMGMFFLQRGRGGYMPTVPNHPALVGAWRASDADTADADPLARVTDELVQALSRAAGSEGGATTFKAAAALATVPGNVAGPRLLPLARSSDANVRLWALYCLVRIGDSPRAAIAQSLAALKAALRDPPAESEFPVGMLAQAIQSNLATVEAVPTLVALLGSRDVRVRRAAASALGDVQDPRAAAALRRAAVADSDPEVRAIAWDALSNP
jgi:hypothetical protein